MVEGDPGVRVEHGEYPDFVAILRTQTGFSTVVAVSSTITSASFPSGTPVPTADILYASIPTNIVIY